MSKPSFPLVAIENVKWHCIAVYCNFNHNEPFWGHYWALYNARRCIIWCFFFQFKDLFLSLQGGKNVLSLPLWNSGPGWGPWPCLAVPTRPGTPGAAGGSWKGQPWTASVPSAPGCGRALPGRPRPSTPSLASEASLSYSRFSILTKALYRTVLITFRC